MSQVPMNQGSLDQGQMPAALPGAVALESMGRSGPGASIPAPGESAERELVGEGLVRAAAEGSELVIPPRARVTPMARDLAFQKGITFVTGRSAEPLAPVASVGRQPARIAVASDHGGFELKSQLIPLLREMGERPVDLGPDTAEVSVDYPDFASLVAREVSEGRVHLGIIVDGAGIGSAMVANKVPGVLAANCWNAAWRAMRGSTTTPTCSPWGQGISTSLGRATCWRPSSPPRWARGGTPGGTTRRLRWRPLICGLASWLGPSKRGEDDPVFR